MSSTSFDLISIINTLLQWRKQLLIMTILALLISTVLALLVPKQYESFTEFYPANSLLGDRSHLFRNDFEALHPYFGDGNDVDRLYATAQSSTVRGYLVQELQLAAHYDIDTTLPNAKEKAAKQLKKHLEITRTELGSIRITVRDKNSKMAAQIANLAVAKISAVNQSFIQRVNEQIVSVLDSELVIKQQLLLKIQDKARNQLQIATLQSLLQELTHYQQLRDEFFTSSKTGVPAVYVLEKAYPAKKTSYPVVWLVITGGTLGTVFFSLISILLLEYYRRIKPQLYDHSSQP